MPKIISICRNGDFRRLYAKGNSAVTPYFALYYRKTALPCCRLGITASKKLGGAVGRNRARRVLREAYRAIADQISGNYDIVLVARKKCLFSKSTAICEHMRSCFSERGII